MGSPTGLRLGDDDIFEEGIKLGNTVGGVEGFGDGYALGSIDSIVGWLLGLGVGGDDGQPTSPNVVLSMYSNVPPYATFPPP